MHLTHFIYSYIAPDNYIELKIFMTTHLEAIGWFTYTKQVQIHTWNGRYWVLNTVSALTQHMFYRHLQVQHGRVFHDATNS